MEIQPSNHQLAVAWAAGLFEGEGCFSTSHRQNGRATIVATLGTTDKDVLERFASIVGCGTIYPRKPQKAHWKLAYEWRVVEAAKVREIIASFMPYLGERRRATAQRTLEVALEIAPHNSQKTHCPNGHPLKGENLILEPYIRKGVRYLARRCQICSRARSRNRMRRINGTTPDRYRVN